MATFSPPQQPAWDLEEPRDYSTLSDPFDSGDIATRARWERGRRRWHMLWQAANQATRDYVVGFVRHLIEAADTFSWLLPVTFLYEPRPAVGPDTNYTTGGALAQTTYYVSYTWANANGETEDSPEVSRLVPASRFLQVTVPRFPSGVTEARVYVGTVAGTRFREATISTSRGTWTQAGALTGSLAPPTSNGMSETIRARLRPGGFTPPVAKAPGVWTLGLEIEEVLS